MEKGRRGRMTVWICAAVLLAALAVWIYLGNVTVGVSEYIVADGDIPQAFDGFRIAQISDLHNAGLAGLIPALEAARPDIIVVTGDLIDSRHTDVRTAVDAIKKAAALAPVYYVAGNHESRLHDEYAVLETGLLGLGVHVLHDAAETLTIGGQSITLAGLDDPDFRRAKDRAAPDIAALTAGAGYTVLLSHRPELLLEYSASGANLVFAGHAHGGQFRIPFIGGVFAPGQGFFPKYDAGRFELGGTVMIVSRGLGNSLFPFRVNNAPELVVAELCIK